MGRVVISPTSRARGTENFAKVVRSQLGEKQRVVRTFDVGGSGVKTALVSALALQDFLHLDPNTLPEPAKLPDLRWDQKPELLGAAPGDSGFAGWLLESVPRLKGEVSDPNVFFGVSVGGDVDHMSGVINDWWPGGGHPRSWSPSRPSPLLADLMGLPPSRTFVIHDGEAHLLGCSRSIVPPPGLGCLALGTGVGFGMSDFTGSVIDPNSRGGSRSLALNGVPLSGSPYRGIWDRWLENPSAKGKRVQALMAQPFANMNRPWQYPWVSLVLGRRGMELAEAAHDVPEYGASGLTPEQEAEARAPAVRAYAEQWLHFLHTEFLPQYCGGKKNCAQVLAFAGGVAEANWPLFSEVLLHPETGKLRPLPAELLPKPRFPLAKRGRGRSAKKDGAAEDADSPDITILPPAPSGSALIGAALYALAGAGGAHSSIWAE